MSGIEEILTILQDAAIAPIYANYATNKDEDCIVYSFYVVSADKVTRHLRLKVTIISSSARECETIERRISDLILTFGDEPLTRNAISVRCNGGGSLYDEARNKEHKILYYDIIERYQPL